MILTGGATAPLYLLQFSSNRNRPMTTTASALSNLSADDLQDLRRAVADSGCYWHHLWQDCMDGKRPDLDADSCRRISRKSWDLWQRLGSIA